MSNAYTINIVNNSAESKTFWCFLAPPRELANDRGVFANSSACLAVNSNDRDNNQFRIPVQYVVGAGASNEAVGLNIRMDSNATNDAELGDAWTAAYADAPPNRGPSLSRASTGGPANSITVVSSPFDKVASEETGWFANQSFGIQTEMGFVGMSWSPDPHKTIVLTPKLAFYVSTGDFGRNQLADWDSISNRAARIDLPGSFEAEQCTVTLNAEGACTVRPGGPPRFLPTD